MHFMTAIFNFLNHLLLKPLQVMINPFNLEIVIAYILNKYLLMCIS